MIGQPLRLPEQDIRNIMRVIILEKKLKRPIYILNVTDETSYHFKFKGFPVSDWEKYELN